MSEDVRLNSLRERIVDAMRNEKNGVVIFSMGAALVYLGLVISVLGNSAFAYVLGVFAIVLGTVSTILGFYVALHFTRRCNSLLKEVSDIAEMK